MRKGIVVSAAAFAVTAAAVTPAVAAPRPANGPDGVTVEIAAVNGTGCPPGTAAVALSDDKEAFTVTYSDYMAQAGGSSRPIDHRKQCLLSLNLHVPQGYTYAVSSADYRGYAHLADDAGAVVGASYYFQGNPQTGRVLHNLKGTFDENWQFTDRAPADQLIWKPCGEDRNLNIITELRASDGNPNSSKVSFIAMDSTDSSIRSTYHFVWKHCY
ncbi:DUF4360 domain-containing protein [Actinomadura terrae]|uniref:DUF4360 domain-containing protein n=1 Tax=Actinomadura terrae TaxID=604353 RepID=UPI001FA75FE0|nr:DUF4360 domain-containing protein [Actinomadura terrae]